MNSHTVMLVISPLPPLATETHKQTVACPASIWACLNAGPTDLVKWVDPLG